MSCHEISAGTDIATVVLVDAGRIALAFRAFDPESCLPNSGMHGPLLGIKTGADGEIGAWLLVDEQPAPLLRKHYEACVTGARFESPSGELWFAGQEYSCASGWPDQGTRVVVEPGMYEVDVLELRGIGELTTDRLAHLGIPELEHTAANWGCLTRSVVLAVLALVVAMLSNLGSLLDATSVWISFAVLVALMIARFGLLASPQRRRALRLYHTIEARFEARLECSEYPTFLILMRQQESSVADD
ncbi:MAG: hypothetical protein NXI31_18275 [bacterium]|nr:hypothetical protein [bacterium]